MRRVLKILFLTMFYRFANGLLCFQNDSFNISTKNFSLKNLREILREEKLTEKLYCGGTIRWNVMSNELSVEFTADAFALNVLGQKNINMETTLILENLSFEQRRRTDSIRSQVTFLCHNRDRCDQFLLLEQFEQILCFNYSMLINVLRLSIIETKEKRNECSTGKNLKVENCFGRACFLNYSYKSNRIDGQCLLNPPEFLPKLVVKTSLNARERLGRESENQTNFYHRDSFTDDFTVEFFCSFNNCNNRKTSELIIESIQNYYYRWILTRFKSVQTLVESMEKENSTENSSNRSFSSICSLIVSILMLRRNKFDVV